MGGAILGEACVGGCEVFVKEGVETARPCLLDVVFLELGDEVAWFVAGQAAERPVGQVDVGVDNHG